MQEHLETHSFKLAICQEMWYYDSALRRGFKGLEAHFHLGMSGFDRRTGWRIAGRGVGTHSR